MRKVYNAQLVWQIYEDRLRDRAAEKMARLAACYAMGVSMFIESCKHYQR